MRLCKSFKNLWEYIKNPQKRFHQAVAHVSILVEFRITQYLQNRLKIIIYNWDHHKRGFFIPQKWSYANLSKLGKERKEGSVSEPGPGLAGARILKVEAGAGSITPDLINYKEIHFSI